MIFVRNENGSHDPHETRNMHEILTGLTVMRGAILELAR